MRLTSAHVSDRQVTSSDVHRRVVTRLDGVVSSTWEDIKCGPSSSLTSGWDRPRGYFGDDLTLFVDFSWKFPGILDDAQPDLNHR